MSTTAGEIESAPSGEVPPELFETAAPRGLDVDLPADVDPAPMPISVRELWSLVVKTYQAERRWYPKLKRQRPMSARRIVSSIRPSLRRPIFIVGAARSGTSFLGNCIGRIPEISYHREPPATKAAGRYVYEGLWSDRRARRFFRATYAWSLRLELDGDLRFCEKTPTNIFIMPFLAKLFPDAQFVHIIRDGRDAASSHMGKPWLRAAEAASGEREPGGELNGPWPKFWVEPERREEFTSTSDARRMAWAWRRYTEAGLADGPALGEARYHELRYEALTRDPQREAERLLDFLDIEREASRATFSEAMGRAKEASVGRWRSTFYRSELADIDAEAGDLLRRLGYDD